MNDIVAYIAFGIIAVLVIYMTYVATIASIVNIVERRLLDSVIEPTRKKLNGKNRFLLNQEILEGLLPSLPRFIVRKVWKRFVEMRIVEKDSFDDEWCIR